MMRKLISVFILFTSYATPAATQLKVAATSSVDIVPWYSTHIYIAKDSLIVANGSTYSFSVDTPEDSGLVSTNTTVKVLLSEINSKNGTTQQYEIFNKDGGTKNEGVLVTGDRLVNLLIECIIHFLSTCS